MSGTEELRRLLNERGVEYTQAMAVKGTLFIVVTSKKYYFILVRDNDAGIEMWSRDLTPEQAISATLGAGTCKRVKHDGDSVFEYCSECGGMLARWLEYDDGNAHFCPSCGRKVVES